MRCSQSSGHPTTGHRRCHPAPSAYSDRCGPGSDRPCTWSRPADTAPAPCPPAGPCSCCRSAGPRSPHKSLPARPSGRSPGPGCPAFPAGRPGCRCPCTGDTGGPFPCHRKRGPGSGWRPPARRCGPDICSDTLRCRIRRRLPHPGCMRRYRPSLAGMRCRPRRRCSRTAPAASPPPRGPRPCPPCHRQPLPARTAACSSGWRSSPRRWSRRCPRCPSCPGSAPHRQGHWPARRSLPSCSHPAVCHPCGSCRPRFYIPEPPGWSRPVRPPSARPRPRRSPA